MADLDKHMIPALKFMDFDKQAQASKHMMKYHGKRINTEILDIMFIFANLAKFVNKGSKLEK